MGNFYGRGLGLGFGLGYCFIVSVDLAVEDLNTKFRDLGMFFLSSFSPGIFVSAVTF